MRSKPDSLTVSRTPSAASLEFEDDERRGLGGVIDAGLDGVRMPAEGEAALGLHFLDGDLECLAFIGFLKFSDFGIDFWSA